MAQFREALMRYRHLTLVFLSALILTFPSCKNQNQYGKMGIQVPIGEGKVRDAYEEKNGIVNGPYRVTGVFEGSPADIAGVKPDDIILQIDGTAIAGKSYDEVYHNHLMGKPGSSVMLHLKRGDRQVIVKVIRGELP